MRFIFFPRKVFCVFFVVVVFNQAAEQYKARLKGSLALMGEKRTKLAASRDEIEQKLQNCKEQKDTLQQDILKQADTLVKGIRQVDRRI